MTPTRVSGVCFRAGIVLALAALPACRPRPTAAPVVPETREHCEARAKRFGEFVAALPEAAVAAATRTDLPVAAIGRAPGTGPVVEVSPRDLAIEGRPVAADLPGRLAAFRAWVAGGGASGTAQKVIYFAASADTDVRFLRTFVTLVPPLVELRLLVRVSESRQPKKGEEPATRGAEAGARLLEEPDARNEKRIADAGYAEFSRCGALSSALSAVPAGPSRERWPRLRGALLSAFPGCACGDVDTDDLRSVVSAEQRAGVGSLAYLPLSFLRDERCDASMPLRSMEKLVKQLEQFDAEFSAQFQKDAVAFGDVLTNDRLRVYFCDALPGETFAERARARGTLYVRVPGAASCDAWTFTPLAPGSPMGTALRATQAGRPPLAFHYWQGAEEIRWFGPVDGRAASSPTDARDYPCDETYRLTGIDEAALHLGSLAWFFDEAACRVAESAPPGLSGCVAERAYPAPAVDAH